MAEYTSIHRKKTRGQIWGLDLIVAGVIFITGILIAYTYALNFSSPDEEINKLLFEGNSISDTILSEGWPVEWSNSNVVSPGILTQNKINQSKLELLYNLSQQDYARLKLLLNTNKDFYFYLSEQMNIGGNYLEGIGKPGLNSSTIAPIENPKNIIRINRFTIYQEKPVSFYLYVWG